MGGFFGVVSKSECVGDLFYGTDYHSHLGTRRAGLAVMAEGQIKRSIHDITNAQFRSKFYDELPKLSGRSGIGVISDYEDQPLIIGSHLGLYAIVTVGAIKNAKELESKVLKRGLHFSEMSGSEVNSTELVATLINQGENFTDGLRMVQEAIDGSCSMLLLTEKGIYAARDRYGRTPIVVGRKDESRAVTLETCALPNLGYEEEKVLGPGEIVLVNQEGVSVEAVPGDVLQICTFLWIYFGYPASSYEGINVEATRYRCGAALARRETIIPDCVAGIPDSGTSHAIGYANEARLPHVRPFVKYTPTWPRSFIPPMQETRDLVAKMKLIPVSEIIAGKRILFCDDSIVRGTQLKDTIQRIFDFGAREVHMRTACPPLIFGCKFLNFSRMRSSLDLAARKAIKELEGSDDASLEEYINPDSEKYAAMVDRIRNRMGLTSLRYQHLDDMVTAIGLPKNKLCTYCWDGCDGRKCGG